VAGDFNRDGKSDRPLPQQHRHGPGGIIVDHGQAMALSMSPSITLPDSVLDVTVQLDPAERYFR
jgi:hypothetical protein